MCVMSAVTDHFQQQWPADSLRWGLVGVLQVTQAEWDEYQRLKTAAGEIDRITGHADCVKPGVDAWEAVVKTLIMPTTGDDYVDHLVGLGIEQQIAKQMLKYADSVHHRFKDAHEAFWSFGEWAATPQGLEYWSDLADSSRPQDDT